MADLETSKQQVEELESKKPELQKELKEFRAEEDLLQSKRKTDSEKLKFL